jgi:hypothetical protein
MKRVVVVVANPGPPMNRYFTRLRSNGVIFQIVNKANNMAMSTTLRTSLSSQAMAPAPSVKFWAVQVSVRSELMMLNNVGIFNNVNSKFVTQHLRKKMRGSPYRYVRGSTGSTDSNVLRHKF